MNTGRVALGASSSQVAALVVGHGARLALAGVVIGLVAAFGLTRVLTELLYGVKATDPFSFVGVSLVLGLVAVVASWVPARRAMRVDPVVAMRRE